MNTFAEYSSLICIKRQFGKDFLDHIVNICILFLQNILGTDANLKSQNRNKLFVNDITK